ncbi:MAG TPA: helix-turn-helix transcriptional regulator [bacterium]|nr:helix-turn-helix transcriptional regulator [bacterium]
MLRHKSPLVAQIRSARLALGITQGMLAKKVGLPQSHLSKIENSQVNITMDSLIEITRALGLEILLVPRGKITLVKALIESPSTKDNDRLTRPAYELDDEQEKESP